MFPARHPESPPVHVWIAGICATLLFFGSVLAHELSHSLVARALGLRVIGITLFVFGGVSTLAHDPDDGWTEMKVAAAGPMLSFSLGATFWVLASAASISTWASPLLSEVLGYLAFANLVLGVFNLVPGFPLDGGRVLRAVWWIATGSLHQATRVATGAGTVVALLLVALGGLSTIGGDLAGLWLVLIGLFLWSAAGASRRDMELRHTLAGALVRDVMIADPVAIPAGVTVAEAVSEYFVRFGLDACPVIKNGHLRGVVSLNDVEACPAPAREVTTVEEAMTPLENTPTVGPEVSVREAMQMMARTGREHLLVVAGDDPVGLITLGAVRRFLRIAATRG